MSKEICLISFPNKFAGAQQVPCDLCGLLCYEQPENVQRARELKGYIICVFCALKVKMEVPDLNLHGQLWHGELRKPEPVGDINELLVKLLEKKS